MIYARAEIADAVEHFWNEDFPAEYPCDVVEAVPNNLPVSLEFIPDLTVGKVVEWMRKKDILSEITSPNRRLYGCLVAVRGIGFILVDEKASLEEQQFTAAHEVGHYLFDYFYPRREALAKLGEGVLATLDGLRQATLEERQEALLAGLKLDKFFSLMERSGDGAASFETHCSESRADEFALELIAPASEVLDRVDFAGLSHRPPFEARRDLLKTHLTERYGLPLGIAGRYAENLLEQAGQGKTMTESFFRF